MKAVLKKIGEAGIEVVDVPYPKLKPGYVIVKVKAAGICGSDLHSYLQTTARFPEEPIGHEGAGEVAEVGAGVEDFVVGDRVTYNPHAPRTNQFCGKCIFCLTGRPLGCPERPNMRLTDGGCMAEYQSIKATALFKLPRNVSYDVGSVVEPFGVSYHGVLETSSLKEDQTIVFLVQAL